MFVFTLLASVLVALPATSASAATSVFINEIHYDNDGADDDEFVEIAGPAGTDLCGLDRGALQRQRRRSSMFTTPLSWPVRFPTRTRASALSASCRAGIQNGSPDGLALVDGIDGRAVPLLRGVVHGRRRSGCRHDQRRILGSSEASTTPGRRVAPTDRQRHDVRGLHLDRDPSRTRTVRSTPARSFGGTPTPPDIVINEVDYDQVGTDAAEFLELKNVGVSTAEPRRVERRAGERQRAAALRSTTRSP